MAVTITAHTHVQSLLEISGLAYPPKAIMVQGRDGMLISATLASTISELWSLGGAGYMSNCSNGHCTTMIHPWMTGNVGHFVNLLFGN